MNIYVEVSMLQKILFLQKMYSLVFHLPYFQLKETGGHNPTTLSVFSCPSYSSNYRSG